MAKLDRIIARRSLERKNGETVWALVGEPRPVDGDEQDFECRYRLEASDGSEIWSGSAMGVDSIQALIFALAMIGDRLTAEQDDLTFMTMPELGFPVTQLGGGSMWTAQVSYRISR